MLGMKKCKDGESINVYILKRDPPLSDGNTTDPFAYTSKEVASNRAKAKSGEFVAWKVISARAIVVMDGSMCIVDRLVYDLNTESYMDLLRGEVLRKLSVDEKRALGLLEPVESCLSYEERYIISVANRVNEFIMDMIEEIVFENFDCLPSLEEVRSRVTVGYQIYSLGDLMSRDVIFLDGIPVAEVTSKVDDGKVLFYKGRIEQT